MGKIVGLAVASEGLDLFSDIYDKSGSTTNVHLDT